MSDVISTGRLYFNTGKWSQEEFCKHLKLLLTRDATFDPYQKGGGNDSWVLDAGNNWWLLFMPGGVARLTYRYPRGLAYDEFWGSLSLVVNVLLHLNPLTEEQMKAVSDD